MSKAQQYQAKALACIEAARRASDADRDILLEVGRRWLNIAREFQKDSATACPSAPAR